MRYNYKEKGGELVSTRVTGIKGACRGFRFPLKNPGIKISADLNAMPAYGTA